MPHRSPKGARFPYPPPTNGARPLPPRQRSPRLPLSSAAALLGALFLTPKVVQAAESGGPQIESEGRPPCPTSGTDSQRVGDEAMLASDFGLALACYEAAYRYSPKPALLYNRARALEMVGKRAASLELLRVFRRTASPELRARVSGLDELMASLEREVASIQLDCSVAGAEVRVNGASVGQIPLPEPLLVDPGSVLVEVVASGYQPLARTLSARGATQLVVVADLVPQVKPADVPQSGAPPMAQGELAANAPTPRAPIEELVAPQQGEAAARSASIAPHRPGDIPPPDTTSNPPLGSGETIRQASWIALGVGTAAAGVAIVSFIGATGAASEVCAGRSSCTKSEHDSSALERYETWKTWYAASAVAAGLGLAAGGFLLWQSHDSNTEARLNPNGISLLGRF